jgi:hypothetical protein
VTCSFFICISTLAKFTCKICIQAFSFAFPVLLAVPTTVILLISLCAMRDTETCFWNNVMPGYLFWTCPEGDFWGDFMGKEQVRDYLYSNAISKLCVNILKWDTRMICSFTACLGVDILDSVSNLDIHAYLATERNPLSQDGENVCHPHVQLATTRSVSSLQ